VTENRGSAMAKLAIEIKETPVNFVSIICLPFGQYIDLEASARNATSKTGKDFPPQPCQDRTYLNKV
jgi:hypothetical protein